MRLLSKLLILSFVLCISHNAHCQDIYVADFVVDNFDLTANLQESSVEDQNGTKCALIKINTTQTGFTFDVGSLGVTKVVYNPGQVWLYVPHGIKRISIHHQVLGNLTNYNIPLAIESAKTYVMTLTTNTVTTVVTQTTKSDYIVISVEPKNAIVYIDDELIPVNDGIASKFVPCGSYTYNVELDMYHSEIGKITMAGQKKEISVVLKKAFGFLSVSESMAGASVYIDSKFYGNAPLNSVRLKSGSHRISISKPLHRTINKQIVINDEETSVVNELMSPAYSIFNLKVGNEAEIYVDGKKVGVSTWRDKVSEGVHKVECRKQGYSPSVTEITATGSLETIDMTLLPPKPIYGILNITSEPAFASVSIDGKELGRTPLLIDDVIIGDHTVTVSKDGYLPYSQSVRIEKDKQEDLHCKLGSSVDVIFRKAIYDTGVLVYLDGNIITTFNKKMPVTLGSHILEVNGGYNYKSYTKTINITSDKTITIALEESDGYKKYKAEKQKEYNKAARSEKRKAQVTKVKNSFPASFGINANYGAETDKSNNSSDRTFIGFDGFVRFGNIKNILNFDLGGGFMTFEQDKIYNQIPLYFRIDWNMSHRAVATYLAVEARNYYNYGYNIKNMSFSLPVKFGFYFGWLYGDIYFENCFAPYANFHKGESGDQNIFNGKHRFGFEVGIVFW